MPKKKRPVGRPTKYRPEYCEKLIAHCRKGLSFESFGATVGVAKDAVFEWANKHKEFSDAKEIARNLNLLWWEEQGSQGLWNSKQFNSTVWVFSMKNRHGWKDSKALDHNDVTPLNPLLEALKQLPISELLTLIKSTVPKEITDGQQ